MKNTFLALTIVVTSSVAIAQIPNSGFENWTSAGSYENPDGWGTLNNTTTALSIYTATKGTPGSPGNSFLKLTSKTAGSVVVNGIAVSGVLDSMTMTPKSGFAYSGQPQSLTGKWQHMIYGASQGSVSAVLTRWDSGSNSRVVIATANQTLSGMAMSWANFSIPFVYQDGGVPDSCVIILKASGSVPTNNDYLWVDNLAFSGSVLGLPVNKNGEISIFPNPATEQLNIDLNGLNADIVQVELTDLSGKVHFSQETKAGGIVTIGVAGMPKGIYLLRLSANDLEKTQTVVIR